MIAVPITGASFAAVEQILCLSVTMLSHASRDRKTAVMMALGTYRSMLREWEQTLGADAEAALQRRVASETPLTVAFRPHALVPGEDEARQSA